MSAIDGRIQELERSLESLRRAEREAKEGETVTVHELVGVRDEVIQEIEAIVHPEDQGISGRLLEGHQGRTGIKAAFKTAVNALARGWNDIKTLITEEIRRVLRLLGQAIAKRNREHGEEGQKNSGGQSTGHGGGQGGDSSSGHGGAGGAGPGSPSGGASGGR